VYSRRRHLSGKSWHSALISVSVLLSVSCTVHVSGTGPDVYPLTFLQSIISSLAAGGIPADDRRRTTQDASEIWKRPRIKDDIFVAVVTPSYAMVIHDCDTWCRIRGQGKKCYANSVAPEAKSWRTVRRNSSTPSINRTKTRAYVTLHLRSPRGVHAVRPLMHSNADRQRVNVLCG